MPKHQYGFVKTERERNSNVLREGSDEEVAQFIADIVNESIHFAYNYYDFDKKGVLKTIADKLALLVTWDGLEFNNNKFHETSQKSRKFYTKETAIRYLGRING